VDGLVLAFGGQIVEQKHGIVPTVEIVLQRQDLPAVAQRVLRQQADLRHRIDDDAGRPRPFDGAEDQLRGFAKLEIRRVEKALLLVGIEQAFRRHDLEDLDRADIPAVRSSHGAQLVGSLGQGYIEDLLAFLDAFQQESHRYRCLARARAAFEQEDVARGQAAAQHVVESRDARTRLGRIERFVGHPRLVNSLAGGTATGHKSSSSAA